jgi:general secretion pathway protein C
MDLADKLNSLRNQSPAYWATAANQHLPSWFTGVFVVVIAWYLVKMLWLFMPGDNAVGAGAPQLLSPDTQSSAQMTSANFPQIAAAHLFGDSGAEPAQVQTIDAPETRLNLKLRGAIAAEDKSIAHAIITDSSGKDKLYFIDDQLPGGAKLQEVHQNRVILNRNGILETLRLPKISTSGSRASTGRRPAQRAGAIQQAVKQNPSSFTDVLRPQPFMPNGKLAGYRVYPGRDRRRFAALGLRPGDLVTEINGTPLNDLQKGMETFRSLGNASQIVVTIERGSTSMVLTLDSEQIANISNGSGARQ